MAVLYSVTFQKKRFVTRYDKKGRVIEKRDIVVDETIRDLPLTTALNYVKDLGAVISAQYELEAPRAPLHRNRVKFEDTKDAPKRTVSEKKPVKKTAKAPEMSKPADYADLVNTLMEKDE